MKTLIYMTLMVAGVFSAENTIKNRLGQIGMRNLAENVAITPNPPVSNKGF
jgi:hypothetical protein